MLYYANIYSKIQYGIEVDVRATMTPLKKSRPNQIENLISSTTNTTTLHQQRNCTKIYKSFLFKISINLVLQNLHTNKETTSYQTILINFSLKIVTSTPIMTCKLHVEFTRNKSRLFKRERGVIKKLNISALKKQNKTVKQFNWLAKLWNTYIWNYTADKMT